MSLSVALCLDSVRPLFRRSCFQIQFKTKNLLFFHSCDAMDIALFFTWLSSWKFAIFLSQSISNLYNTFIKTSKLAICMAWPKRRAWDYREQINLVARFDSAVLRRWDQRPDHSTTPRPIIARRFLLGKHSSSTSKKQSWKHSLCVRTRKHHTRIASHFLHRRDPPVGCRVPAISCRRSQ